MTEVQRADDFKGTPAEAEVEITADDNRATSTKATSKKVETTSVKDANDQTSEDRASADEGTNTALDSIENFLEGENTEEEIYIDEFGNIVIEGITADGDEVEFTIDLDTDASGEPSMTINGTITKPNGVKKNIFNTASPKGVGNVSAAIHDLNELFAGADIDQAIDSRRFEVEPDYDNGRFDLVESGHEDFDNAIADVEEAAGGSVDGTRRMVVNDNGDIVITAKTKDGGSYRVVVEFFKDDAGEPQMRIRGNKTTKDGFTERMFEPVVVSGQQEVLDAVDFMNERFDENHSISEPYEHDVFSVIPDFETENFVQFTTTISEVRFEPVTHKVRENAEVGTVVGNVEVQINGEWVQIDQLPPSYRDIISAEIMGPEGALTVNDLGQVVVEDPSMLNEGERGYDVWLIIDGDIANGKTTHHEYTVTEAQDAPEGVNIESTFKNTGNFAAEVFDPNTRKWVEVGEYLTTKRTGVGRAVTHGSVESPTVGAGWGADDLKVRVMDTDTKEYYGVNAKDSQGRSIVDVDVSESGNITYTFNITSPKGADVRMELSNSTAAVSDKPVAPVSVDQVNEAHTDALVNYINHLKTKMHNGTATENETLFVELYEAYGLSQDKQLNENADVEGIKTDLQAVMETDEISSGLLEYEDKEFAKINDAGLTQAETAEVMAAYILSDEFVEYLNTLEPDAKNDALDMELKTLASMDLNLAKETLVTVQEQIFADYVDPGLEGNFTEYEVEDLVDAAQLLMDYLHGVGRMSTGADLVYMDRIRILSETQRDQAGQLIGEYAHGGGDLSSTEQFAEFLADNNVEPQVTNALTDLLEGINAHGSTFGLWGILAGYGAYKNLTSGHATEPAVVLKTIGDLMQVAAGSGAVREFLTFTGMTMARGISSAFSWVFTKPAAAQAEIQAEIQGVDWSNNADVAEFVEKYEEEFYEAMKPEGHPPFADATPEQREEVKANGIKTLEKPYKMEQAQKEMMEGLETLDQTDEPAVARFLTEHKEVLYYTNRTAGEPAFEDASPEQIDAVFERAVDKVVEYGLESIEAPIFLVPNVVASPDVVSAAPTGFDAEEVLEVSDLASGVSDDLADTMLSLDWTDPEAVHAFMEEHKLELYDSKRDPDEPSWDALSAEEQEDWVQRSSDTFVDYAKDEAAVESMMQDAAGVDWSNAEQVNEFFQTHEEIVYGMFSTEERPDYADASPAEIREAVDSAKAKVAEEGSWVLDPQMPKLKEMINDNLRFDRPASSEAEYDLRQTFDFADDAQFDAMIEELGKVDLDDPASVDAFLKEYELPFYEANRTPGSVPYAEATPEQIAESMAHIKTKLATYNEIYHQNADMLADYRALDRENPEDVNTFLTNNEAEVYEQYKPSGGPEYADATATEIDTAIDKARVAITNAEFTRTTKTVLPPQTAISRRWHEIRNTPTAPGEEASEGISAEELVANTEPPLGSMVASTDSVEGSILDAEVPEEGLAALDGMTVSEIVGSGWGYMTKLIGWGAAGANIFFGMADIINGVEQLQDPNVDDVDGGLTLAMGLDSLGPIGLVGTWGAVVDSAFAAGVFAGGIGVLFVLATVKFVYDDIQAHKDYNDAVEFLEEGVSNGKSYWSTEEQEAEDVSVHPWDPI